MDITDVKLIKGMKKEHVNALIYNWTLLEDDVYMGINYKHNWRCKCGGIMKSRMWDTIRAQSALDCGCIEYSAKEKRYKYEVEKCGKYEYVKSYRRYETLPNGRKVNGSPYIQVRHKYCGSIYEILATSFILSGSRCTKCCGSYEKSFAHHIEVELGEPLEKHWDFKKNTVNPYHIWKSGVEKVWIKCQEKDYHGSYEIRCDQFINNKRCSYCYGRKVHPKDSFAQYHIDNTDPNFLEKYWDYEKNTVDPFGIAPSSGNKVWIKCQSEDVNELNGLMKKDYHDLNYIKCNIFKRGSRCGYCHTNGKKVHPYDSFGYHNFDKVMSWHPDNEISPFKVAKGTNKKYKFICEECGEEFCRAINVVNANVFWCRSCSSSKGEKMVKTWLDCNKFNYVYDKPYFQDLLGINGGLLRPDFILPNHKVWIEYDGEFHYMKLYEGDYHETLQIHDKIKDEYAKKHGWKMIRIPYWDFDNIENILNKELCERSFSVNKGKPDTYIK